MKWKRLNEERCERGQTIKHIRWKGGERVIIKLMEERKIKGEIEDEMMEEEREIRER